MRESVSSRRHRSLRLAADRGKVYSKSVTRIPAVKCTVGGEMKRFRNLSIEILQADWKLTALACENANVLVPAVVSKTLNFVDGTRPYWWS